jgi:glycine/D-amino acid oxidase-like deaminating enzyme
VTYDVIVAGLGGMGSATAYLFYKFARVIGEMLADLAIDGSTRHPIEPFSPDRLAAPE